MRTGPFPFLAAGPRGGCGKTPAGFFSRVGNSRKKQHQHEGGGEERRGEAIGPAKNAGGGESEEGRFLCAVGEGKWMDQLSFHFGQSYDYNDYFLTGCGGSAGKRGIEERLPLALPCLPSDSDSLRAMSAADLVGATGATLLAAGGVGLCVAAAAAAKRGLIRPKVRCWFCHSDQRVPFAARNGWDCGGCGQYNGFSSDGDYNVDDPARRRRWADGEAPRYARPGAPAEGTSGAGDNGLCHTCNLNQSLKVHQLAKFVPENEADYDREVEAFQDKLEKTYRLCRNCK